MAFTALSAEVRARDLMQSLGISAAIVAILTNIEPSKLGFALRRIKPLTNEDGLRLTTTLNRLLEVRDAIRPFSLDLRDPEMTQQILDAFKDMDTAAIHERIRAAIGR
jgi:hypothetical protein